MSKHSLLGKLGWTPTCGAKFLIGKSSIYGLADFYWVSLKVISQDIGDIFGHQIDEILEMFAFDNISETTQSPGEIKPQFPE